MWGQCNAQFIHFSHAGWVRGSTSNTGFRTMDFETIITSTLTTLTGSDKAQPCTRLSKLRKVSQETRWKRSQSLLASDDDIKPWKLRDGHPEGDERVGSNRPLAALLRTVARALRQQGLTPRMTGGTLLGWTKLSQLAPWETSAHFLVGQNDDDTLHKLVAAFKALPPSSLGVHVDDGGAAVQKDGLTVYMYLKDMNENRVAASPKGNGLTLAKAKRHHVEDKDLKQKRYSEAVLEGSVIVHAPKPKFLWPTLRRWYGGKKVPGLNPPRPWIWSTTKRAYVKAEFLDYYLGPPFGQRTIATLLVMALIIFAIWIFYWVSVNHVPAIADMFRRHQQRVIPQAFQRADSSMGGGS